MQVFPLIRIAGPHDADAIAQMSRRYIEQGLGWSWRAGRVLRSIRDRSTNVAVIAGDEGLLAFGIMQYRDDTAHLSLFAVHPAHRNRGLGGRLVSWLEKPAAVAGVERIHVEARVDNPQAIAFYQRLGFRELARVAGYYSGIIDAVRLEKRL